MTTTPHEREDILTAQANAARDEVAALRAQLAQSDAEHHRRLVAGDLDGAAEVAASVPDVRVALAAAESRFGALDKALRAVNAERQAHDQRAELARLEAVVAAAADEAARGAAEVVAHLQAAQAALAATRDADYRANTADGHAHELRVALGQGEHSRYRGGPSRAAGALIDRHPLINDIRLARF